MIWSRQSMVPLPSRRVPHCCVHYLHLREQSNLRYVYKLIIGSLRQTRLYMAVAF